MPLDVLFAIANVGHLRHFEGPVRVLARGGHRVRVLLGKARRKDSDRTLRSLRCDPSGVETGELVASAVSPKRCLTALARGLRGTAVYLTERHPTPSRAADWGSKNIPFRLARLLTSRPALRLLARPPVQRMLERVEVLVPPSPRVMRALEQRPPDVLVASPFIFGDSPEVEYVKAAGALGIPTVAALASWDNLTTKGTYCLTPDVAAVWNVMLAREAVEIHRLPPDRVVVTGAPTFDYWFDYAPSSDRARFCEAAGLDPARPYLVYLCSSQSITADETNAVRDLLAALRRAESTRDVQILIRPHPTSMTSWEQFRAAAAVVWPPRGDVADDAPSRALYFDTLHHATAAVGINTSAMLEAAIADRPCVTILAERYEDTQIGRAHFRHLLTAGFMDVARSYDEMPDLLAPIVSGADPRRDARRRFVLDFIRPRGLGRPAADVFAQMIELVAQRRSTLEIRQALEASAVAR